MLTEKQLSDSKMVNKNMVCITLTHYKLFDNVVKPKANYIKYSYVSEEVHYKIDQLT